MIKRSRAESRRLKHRTRAQSATTDFRLLNMVEKGGSKLTHSTDYLGELYYYQGEIVNAMTQTTPNGQHDHPIPGKYVRRSGAVTTEEVHHFLSDVDDHVTEETIDKINSATPYENRSENDDVVAAFTDQVWEDVFDEIGLSVEDGEYSNEYVEDARSAILAAHKQFAANELGMDHNQPYRILVARKDQ